MDLLMGTIALTKMWEILGHNQHGAIIGILYKSKLITLDSNVLGGKYISVLARANSSGEQ